MAKHLKNDAQIDNFIARVIREAEDHAPQVAEVIQRLADAVRARLDLAKDRIEIYERKGQLARTCWVTIGGHRYAFSYNYDYRKIDLRDRSTQGKTLCQFDNDSSSSELRRQVQRL